MSYPILTTTKPVFRLYLHLAVFLLPFCQLAQGALSKAFLWRVQQSTHAPVYILGSIHDVPSTIYPLHPSILHAYNQAQTLAFETDLDELKEPDLIFSLFDCIFYPLGECIEKDLSAATYEALKTFAEQHDIELQLLIYCKLPWFLATEVTLKQLEEIGFNTDNAVDGYLFDRAKTDQKYRIALETPKSQFEILCSKPMKQQVADLETALFKGDELREGATNLLSLWSEGRFAEMAAIVEGSAQLEPDYYERLVYQRTLNWVPQVEALLQANEPALVVVGAAHLVGPKGLLAILEKNGAQVAQLPESPLITLTYATSGLHLSAKADPGLSFDLMHSSDLKSWEIVGNLTSEQLQMGTKIELDSNRSHFFQLR